MFRRCKSSNEIKDLIQGNWYFENSNTCIKIRNGEYTVENDSPYSEDYKIIGDTVIITAVEADLQGGILTPVNCKAH